MRLIVGVEKDICHESGGYFFDSKSSDGTIGFFGEK